ncbi:MAG: hypothetical protein A2Z49_04325 [Chloroflexi bacterium RBG_19FT_COMBO_56_12]|nr:MAG: hypothetical protein A2Z49_04325 [Chloroflexi bacterium RBG_19FT_COMBO_56_12]
MFKPVPTRYNVTLLEEEVSRLWKTQRVFDKRRSLRQDASPFIVYERPPSVCGKPGLQDALARVHQDMWLRYKTMRGLRVLRYNGWNTHGLPVELLAEKRLDLTSKGQVEQVGIDRFNDFCRQLALDGIRGWEHLDERLTGWEETNAVPSSHNNQSIASVWSLFKQAWTRGLVYQAERVTPYCPRCGTTLADYESALGTEQIDSQATCVRLPLLEDPGTSLLIWTEHIWNLLGNVAVAVNPNAEYVIVERDFPEGEAGKDQRPEKLILARALLNRVFGEGAVRVYETFRGSKLKGIKYRPLFQFQLADKPAYRVILDDFYISETGSGLQQLTPAFDAQALQLARQNDLPILTPIGPDGMFVSDIRPWRGMFFNDAESYIQQDLQERGLLFRTEIHNQNAAFCCGCGTPLLPVVRNAWYLRIQNSEADWALGRERFWGTPLPLWQCIKCEHQLVIGSQEELSHLAGRNLAEMDLHRPFVDEVAFACPQCDGLMRRLPQVLDAGLDAAALSLPLPPRDVEQTYPADILIESAEQSQAWFYALHALSNLFFDGPAYRRWIDLPTLVEAGEKKASDDHPAHVDPWDVIHDHGADALRWAFLSACSSGDRLKFSSELLVTARNDCISPLWDTYALLVNTAVQAGWNPGPLDLPAQGSPAILDRWISSRLHGLLKELTAALEGYDATAATMLLQSFVADLAGVYIPLSRQRFAEKAAADDRQAVCSTLYQTLVTLSQMLAPFIPFLADEFHHKLVRSFDFSSSISVHLTDWPAADEAAIDLELDRRMVLLQRIASLGRSVRTDAGIALYQPLPGAVVMLNSQDEIDALQPFTDLLVDALHIRQVSYEIDGTLMSPDEVRIILDPHLTVELVQEGLADELIRRIQDFCQKAGFPQDASVHLFINATPRLAGAINAFQTRIMEGTHCLELKLVSQPSSQQSGTESVIEQGRSSRRLYTMIEFDGERATFGIEKVSDH